MATRASAAKDAARSMTDESARIMDSADEMEIDLGKWLQRRAGPLVQRARATPQYLRAKSVVSLWRGLVSVWCTSPTARQRYSAEVRDGLLAALNSMDDETAMALIRGVMADAAETQPARPTAA